MPRHTEPPRVAVLAALLASHTGAQPYFAARVADDLTRIARQLRTIYERRCNGYSDGRGGWSDEAELRDNRRHDRLIFTAAATIEELNGKGAHLETQGDPRGAALHLWFDGHPSHHSPDTAFAIY